MPKRKDQAVEYRPLIGTEVDSSFEVPRDKSKEVRITVEIRVKREKFLDDPDPPTDPDGIFDWLLMGNLNNGPPSKGGSGKELAEAPNF
eukprot:5762601-Pyramimonas_sp.AAC.1